MLPCLVCLCLNVVKKKVSLPSLSLCLVFQKYLKIWVQRCKKIYTSVKIHCITRCNKTYPVVILYRNHCFLWYFYCGICTVTWYTDISVGNILACSLRSVEALARILIEAKRSRLFRCHLEVSSLLGQVFKLGLALEEPVACTRFCLMGLQLDLFAFDKLVDHVCYKHLL